MGHIVNDAREYRLLQQRLDHNVTGAPYSPVFIEILKLLFSPEEAELARQIPLRPTSLSVLSRKIGMATTELHQKIIAMAERGLVFDIEHKGECYIVLAPVVIGFFEFVYMRTRDELPMKELAELFQMYMFQEDRFAHSVFEGRTQIGRALVREETLPQNDYSEVLDWEKATSIITSAKNIGLSLCACRHKAEHLGKHCDAPQKTCLTFGGSAELLIKKGMAERVSVQETMAILETCKTAGLAQIADNVQQQVGFICNCCSCCCGMFQSMKTFNMSHAVVSSNWIAHIEAETCIGCGLCAKACPVGAIDIEGEIYTPTGRKKALCTEELCLGCGVCATKCKVQSLSMMARPQRVFVPETTFDRMIHMALERGKLSNFIFDDPSRLSHRALGRIASIIEKSPPVKAILGVDSIRSAFCRTLVAGVKKYT